MLIQTISMNETNPTRTPKTTSKTGSIQVDQTLQVDKRTHKRAKQLVTLYHSFNIGKRESKINNCYKTFVEKKSFVTICYARAANAPTLSLVRLGQEKGIAEVIYHGI
jgi:hypothetical protein